MKESCKYFNISDGSRPKVLLLGNGINRCFQNNSWNEFLKSITDKNKYPLDPTKYVIPMGLKAAMLSNGELKEKIRKYVENKHGKFSCEKEELLNLVKKIASLPFDYILTTNYSYEIELAIECSITIKSKEIKEKMNYTEGKGPETKYFLHTYNSVGSGDLERQIWHIHGEYRKPDSMILGQYYYGNLLSRYCSILDDRNNYYKNYKQQKVQRISSWVDAFVLGDVYVVGLGMDFSETDLWWLLERKSLLNKEIRGTTIFYEPSQEGKRICPYNNAVMCNNLTDIIDENTCKKQLLNVYQVQVKTLDFEITKSKDYIEFYKKVSEDIECLLKQKVENKQ